MSEQSELIIRHLGIVDYQKTWQKMRDFTDNRTDETCDEIWVLQHPSVFTQGLAGKPEHILNPQTIPVIQTDRGGQVTYHGPGQLILYPLINLNRKNLHARDLVRKLEASVIEMLAELSIPAQSKCDAPGVYVNNEKICSIGLRVRKNCCYHGIALNVDMDLTPFSYINPCGYKDMKMTQIKTFVSAPAFDTIQNQLISMITKNFGYHHVTTV